jgi:hypothetical protein
MKFLQLRRRLTTEATEPDLGPTESAATGPPVPLALQVTAHSRSGLPDEEFSAQTATLRRILSYEGDTRSWYGWLPLDRPERAAEVLTALFEAARVHGTWVQVEVKAAAGDDASG